MNFWIVAAAEPLPMLDGNFREFRCSLLAKALTSRDHDVTWWTSDHDHMRKVPRFGCFKSIEIDARLHLKLLPAPAYQRNISFKRVWHNRIVGHQFTRRAAEWVPRPDLVFACLPTLELADAAVAYARRHCIPIVVDVRDKWPDIYLGVFPGFMQAAIRLALETEFRKASRILRSADAITAVSRTYLEWGLRYAGRCERQGDRVFPLGYSAPPPQAQRRPPDGRYVTFVFVGTFGASYDLATVIDAARECERRSMSRVRFVLVGDGDQGAAVRERARGLRNMEFSGWLDAQQMSERLHGADVGLAAYSAAALQSLPNKLFEYIAAGLPVLSSLRGEQQTLIDSQQIGIHYDSGDRASLLKAIEWMCDHPAERAVMGQRALQLFDQRYRADAVYLQAAQYLEESVTSPRSTQDGRHATPISRAALAGVASSS